MIECAWLSEPSDRPSFDKITKILGQPVDAILKYSSSKQSEVKPVEKVAQPSESPQPAKESPTPSSSSTVSVPQAQPPGKHVEDNQSQSEHTPEMDVEYEEKLNQIIGRARDYLSSPSDVAQIRGAKAVITIAKGGTTAYSFTYHRAQH